MHDLWTDIVATRSYLDARFLCKESGVEMRVWLYKARYVHMQFFPESKTAERIEVAIDHILTEDGMDIEQTLCTIQNTDKSSNMSVATNCKCHIYNKCACHHFFSTCATNAWKASLKQSEELTCLDTISKTLMKSVEKSGGIHYDLPASLKNGEKYNLGVV